MPYDYDFSSLDQTTLKAEIIRYIEADATFADYNFDGSALNSIANLLTYTTLQQNFYLNMTTQELYLDTATLFRNAAAIAKSLNYVPYRMTPARVLTDVHFVDSDQNIEIPQHCKFLIGGVPFTTITTFNVTNTDVTPLELWQMEIVEEDYVFSGAPFELLNGTNISNSYISIKVNGVLWTQYDTKETLNSTSDRYFLTFNNDEKLVVTFGDDIFGKRPTIGSTIEVVYGVTLGVEGNGLRDIVIDQVIDNAGFLDVYTDATISYGGTASETIESIKINAPRFYETQNRALTKNDYKVFIEGHEASDVDLVNVWSGTESTPPVYGTVYAAVKPNGGLYLTAQQKTDLIDYLSNISVMSIRNNIVDATYIYVDVITTAYYYKSFGISTASLRATIDENVQAYFDGITSFTTKIKYSNLIQVIDTPNEISNNLTEIKYFLKFDIAPNNQYNFNVQNVVTEGTLENDYIYDVGGVIKMITGDTSVGTIDYATGIMSFTAPLDATDNILKFQTDSDDFVFEQSNLPLYNGITVTFEGI